MKDLIQKSVVRNILADYYTALETTLYSIKTSYEKHLDNISLPQKEVIVDRMCSYFQVLQKTKQYIKQIDKLMEKEDRNEVFRLCKLIIHLNQFIKEDSKELSFYIKTGTFPQTTEKDTLH